MHRSAKQVPPKYRQSTIQVPLLKFCPSATKVPYKYRHVPPKNRLSTTQVPLLTFCLSADKVPPKDNEGWPSLLETQQALLEVLAESTQSAKSVEVWSMGLVDARFELLADYWNDFQAMYDARSRLFPTMPGGGGQFPLPGPHSGPRLASINIPLFSGRREDWQSFRDLFQALIHQDAWLTDVERLYYLKANVHGEAKAVLDILQLVGSNYSTAWNLLVSRFEHRRLLVQDHVMALRTLKPLRKESAAGLQSLLDALEKHRDQLRALNQPVEHWDVWMVSFASTAMDPSTRRAWEDKLEKLEAASSAQGEAASFATLSSFLWRRGRSLTLMEESRPPRSTNDPVRSTGSRPPAPTPLSHNHRSLATHAVNDDCPTCHAPQYPGHMATVCPSQGVCQYCKARHHSLIHDGGRKRRAAPDPAPAEAKQCLFTSDSKDGIDAAAALPL
ncbi:uncharacterized protein LOC106639486 [Copidosoma floridanum]|uniref:uncharacterized protein LOC106639486 n=1 Tax=Copidosoma floridanum TaxID=29053 RepID=UPI0006C9919A|nr:uncharacterized protein LOC106639486 [Copidosoma floridanum]